MRRQTYAALCFVLLLSALFPFPAQTAAPAAGIKPVQTDQTGVTLFLSTPDYSLDSALNIPGGYKHLTVPGYESTQEPGQPALPVKSFLLAVPAQAQPRLIIQTGKPVTLPGFHRLAPASQPVRLEDGTFEARVEYSPDQEVYGSNEWVPARQSRIMDDAWMRDQRLIRVEIYPFQYQPASGRITWYPYVEVRVDFQAGETVPSTFSPNIPNDSTAHPLDPVLQSLVVNDEQAQSWRSLPPLEVQADPFPVRPNAADAVVTYFKIVVDQDNLYKLDYSTLLAAGLNPDNIDPAAISMINQGRDVAIYVHGEEDGKFNLGDYILFYGEQFRGDYLASRYASENQNWLTFKREFPDGSVGTWKGEFNATMMEQYTIENAYWLVVGGSPVRMPTQDGDPASSIAATPASYRTTVHIEDQKRIRFYNFTGEDIFFGDSITDWNYHSFPITLTAVVTGSLPAELRGEIYSSNGSPTLLPDHHTQIFFNSVITPTVDETWDGLSRYHFDALLSDSDLKEGVNSIGFNAISLGLAASYYPDWFELEYNRAFQAEKDQLFFSADQAGEWKYQLHGFSNTDLLLFDISDPLNPIQIRNSDVITSTTGVTMTTAITSSKDAQYFASSAAAAVLPKTIQPYTPHLRSPLLGADYLFISHPNFIGATQALADYRQSQGMRTLIVDVEDVYNEFSYGIRQPLAIKELLRWSYGNWQSPAPTYVMLVGDGTLNPRGFHPEIYGTEPNYMLPYFAFVDPWQGQVESTTLLAAFIGDDPLPDVMISRMPVNTAEQMTAVVNKIIAYESKPIEAWQRSLLFIADTIPDEAGDFELSAENIIQAAVKPGFTPLRVYASDYCTSGVDCPAVRTALITDTLNQDGALLAMYFGHGTVRAWASENILNLSAIPSISNSARLPVFVSLDCLDGFWQGTIGPGTKTWGPALAEELLRTPGNGSVSAFAPGGLGVAAGHDLMLEGFLDSIFQDGNWILGQAAQAGKVAIYNTPGHNDLIMTYNILGDPALRLASPYRMGASAPLSSQSMAAGKTASYGFTITNQGAITDTYTLALSSSLWPVSSTPVGPLAPGESAQGWVNVTIPVADFEKVDKVTFSITSEGDRAQKASFTFTTTALYPPGRILLPFVIQK